MERLEDVLAHIEKLRRDLFAFVTIQDEESHWEETGCIDPSVGIWCIQTGEDKIVHKERKVKPDISKRDAALRGLWNLYDSSEWYSVKYSAGKLLGLDVDSRLESWTSDLVENLHSTTTLGQFKSITPQSKRNRDLVGGRFVRETNDSGEESYKIESIDGFKRIKAIKDLGELTKLTNSSDLKELLRREYDENGYIHVRKIAGEALGYYKLRILAHNHPRPVFIAEAAASLGAAAGLGYMLQYFFGK